MTLYSRLESGVELHSRRRVASLSSVMCKELILLMVFFVKIRKENIGKECRLWDPNNVIYA